MQNIAVLRQRPCPAAWIKTKRIKRNRRRPLLLHVIGDREHKLLIDRDHAFERQALPIIPGEPERMIGRQLLAIRFPFGIGGWHGRRAYRMLAS